MSSVISAICSNKLEPNRIPARLIHSVLLLGLVGVIWVSGKEKISSLIGPFPTKRREEKKRDRKNDLENWIKFQMSYSFEGLLDAFGPDGRNAPGVRAGVMIASPSRPGSYLDPKTENENYFFDWTRDSGLCLRVILRRLDEVELGIDDDYYSDKVEAQGSLIIQLKKIVHQFIETNSVIQLAPNLSGGPHDGGLGEPKFQIDGSRFDAPWGRPQNDGPAIRASTLIRYAKHLIKDRKNPEVGLDWIKSSKLYDSNDRNSQIILDLEHVLRTWRKPTFDLWEEVKADKGGHFYTLMVQRKSIQDYIEFIDLLPKESRPSLEAIRRAQNCLSEMDSRLEEFWNPEGLPNREGGPNDDHKTGINKAPLNFLNQPHIVPTLDRIQGQPKPSQVDTAVILAINHTAGPNQPEQWSPASDRTLATLDRLVRVFEDLYPINLSKSGIGVAVGRYPEDEYDGINGNSIGHPWFLCTHAIVETIFLAINQFQSSQKIKINNTNRSFFLRFLKEESDGDEGNKREDYDHRKDEVEIGRGDLRFRKILKGMRDWADKILSDVSWKFSDGNDGRMSEQIDRFSGRMRGARELTWSYASFLTAIEAREGKTPN